MDPLTIFSIITGSINLYEFFYKVIKDLDDDNDMGNYGKKFEAKKKLEAEMIKQKVEKKCTGQEINILTEVTSREVRTNKEENVTTS